MLYRYCPSLTSEYETAGSPDTCSLSGVDSVWCARRSPKNKKALNDAFQSSKPKLFGFIAKVGCALLIWSVQ